jgi:hypothetical protein
VSVRHVDGQPVVTVILANRPLITWQGSASDLAVVLTRSASRQQLDDIATGVIAPLTAFGIRPVTLAVGPVSITMPCDDLATRIRDAIGDDQGVLRQFLTALSSAPTEAT